MSGGGAAAARPRARRDEQRLGVEVREPDGRDVGEALDADVAAAPLREELAVERVEPLELEDVVGEEQPAPHEASPPARRAFRGDDVGEGAEVEGELARADLARPGDRLDDEELREDRKSTR